MYAADADEKPAAVTCGLLLGPRKRISDMRALFQKSTRRLPNDRGQTMGAVVLALSLFLLGAVAFGVDIAHMWSHRQAAQPAADAACTAGAMDMLFNAEGVATYSWIN